MDKLTVLLLHGLGGDRRGLRELADALDGVEVVVPDLPGYGASPPLAVPHTLENYAAEIERLRLSLGLERFVLAGHSLGASISLVYAARYGSALDGLVLLNPVSEATGLTAWLGKLYYRIGSWLPPRAARFWLCSKPAVYLADAFVIVTKDRARRRWILDMDYENYRNASVPAMVEAFLSYFDTKFGELAASITVPTLVVTGTRDGIAPVDAVTTLAACVPDSELVIEPGAGHLFPAEDPTRAAELLAAFLPRVALTDTPNVDLGQV
ncbi:alpha/beta fold hydrolase [Kutzneria buriramensis]|uniref:Pimeloyl-ACP methyl ester carboxylesterase n=1 Tax=Kutzneria buriramensis TaxID=1045776 RepID=A0A3E0GU28_9PSEU|nr:alpha/beta hydrolase [Kutzneria buriramensis]REH27060.1 pimeloyl-ACP methyl ester carboxylesterase [Kutzneria buriramensis]